MDFSITYKGFLCKYLGRGVAAGDGVEESKIAKAEAALGVRLPIALREYYRLLGVPLSGIAEADPIVWQRNNTPSVEWYSEEKSFSFFMASMFDWYKSENFWDN
ncbi:MAG: hypothetical protein JXM70_14600 [Pirellulales bacterium]|nr:hypothetical protein [Pirellulales bacterium]